MRQRISPHSFKIKINDGATTGDRVINSHLITSTSAVSEPKVTQGVELMIKIFVVNFRLLRTWGGRILRADGEKVENFHSRNSRFKEGVVVGEAEWNARTSWIFSNISF